LELGIWSLKFMAVYYGCDIPEDCYFDLDRDVYSLPTDVPVERLVSLKAAYDRYATTLEDVDAHVPLTHLHDAVDEGRVGGLAPRFHAAATARWLERKAAYQRGAAR
jgi:hypothetical protein